MRVIRWFIGTLVLAVLILLALVPFALKWYVIAELESLGSQAQIHHMGFNPINGEITLYDIQIRTVEGDEFNVFSSILELDLLALLQKRIIVRRAEIKAAHIDVRRDGDKWVVAGFGKALTLPKYAGDITFEINYLSVENSELCRQAQAQCLRIEQGYFNSGKLSRVAQQWSFAHDGRMHLVKAFLRERINNSTLFYVGDLEIEKGSYAVDSLSLKNVQFQNVQFIESELGGNSAGNTAGNGADAPYQTQVGDLVLSSLDWQRNGDMENLSLGPINATSVRQSLQRNASSELVLPVRVRLWMNRFSRKFAANTLRFHLAELNTFDGAFAWTDRSVTPAAQGNIAALKVHFGTLDSTVPNSPTAFNIEGKVSANGQLKFEGDIYPFLRPSKFSFSGAMESLDIASLSGYSLGLLDQRVKKGMIDVVIHANADKGAIKASSRWQWTDFVIEPNRSNNPNMPLETAYEILKDHNNSIKFDLNISGDTTKVLDMHTIFAGQVRGNLTRMARGQVKNVGEAVDDSNKPNLAFAPLYYVADARFLAEAEFTRLKEIAVLLVNKPQLKMTFCPVVTMGEWLALYYPKGESPPGEVQIPPEQQQSLLDLGSARGRSLYTSLLEEGVGVDQIVICNSRLDLTQAGMSYISVSL